MSQKGFTLLELLIIIAVVAVLMAVAYVAINPAERLAQARDAERITDIHALADAMELYALDNDGYPAEADGYNGKIGIGGDIDTLLADYIAEVPADPAYDSDHYYYFDALHACWEPGYTEYFVSFTIYNFESELYQEQHENFEHMCSGSWGGEGGASPVYVIKLAPEEQ